MKSKLLKHIVFFSLCIITLTALFFTLSKDINNSIVENPYLADDYYILTEYEGKLAVFKNGDNVPISIYDTYIDTLPKHDKELIQKGIRVESTDSLQRLIEDYTG